MKNALICLMTLAMLSLFIVQTACDEGGGSGDSDSDGDSDGDSDSDTDSDTDSDAEGEAIVSGIADRDWSSCPPSQDGIGDLCVFLLADCDDFTSAVANVSVTNADMSWPDNTIPFEIANVPDGTWQIWGFLDDDGSGCAGDVTTGDFWPNGCAEVTVSNQEDVDGVVLTFLSKCP